MGRRLVVACLVAGVAAVMGLDAAAAQTAALGGGAGLAVDAKSDTVIFFPHAVAQAHEIKPHRWSIPMQGVEQGESTQLRLKLTISVTGEVVKAEASGDDKTLKFWPAVEGEVEQWRFTPFENDGKAVVAEIEEFVDLVPPERVPKVHVAAPEVRPDSKVTIALRRTDCYGTCPAYTVTVGTNGIVYDGDRFVVVKGTHADRVDAGEVRELAKRFVGADFYSMDEEYAASVTDNPFETLTLTIDGRKKSVTDYVGLDVGMPGVVRELEHAVDELARSDRWVKGSEGLVDQLTREKFNPKSDEAQAVLKRAVIHGANGTVQELLAAGVSVKPMTEKKAADGHSDTDTSVGWLRAAGSHPEELQSLLGAGASRKDQRDKDLALVDAAKSGNVASVRALIAYGANPNIDLSKVTPEGKDITSEHDDTMDGSVLIEAAKSGNPEMVGEILKYDPELEAEDRDEETAMFAAAKARSEYRQDNEGRVECVKLLAAAGADVNAQGYFGNTPLHETDLTDVAAELLKLGADVNARNDAGETPIFTARNDDVIPLFVAHRADLTIRNKKGQTVMEAAVADEASVATGAKRVEALRKAIQELAEK